MPKQLIHLAPRENPLLLAYSLTPSELPTSPLTSRSQAERFG